MRCPVVLTDQTGAVVDMDAAVNFQGIADEGIATINEDRNAVAGTHLNWRRLRRSVAIQRDPGTASGFRPWSPPSSRGHPLAGDAIGIGRGVLIRARAARDDQMSRMFGFLL